MAGDMPVIEISKVTTRFGEHVVHDGLDLEVRRAEIFALIGGSGSGKSTLLREMILLQRPDAGAIRVLGVDLQDIDDTGALALRQRWGVMFQHGGLFGSLTVKENVGLPLREHTGLDNRLIDEIADWKLAMTGLAPEVGAQYPTELSGGMLKRASLARSLSLDPELLFLDEPTAGLDPIGAAAFDQLILTLRDALGLTVFIVTHDLDTIYTITDRVAVLAQKKVLVNAGLDEVAATDDAWIREYFHGPRGRAAATAVAAAQAVPGATERN